MVKTVLAGLIRKVLLRSEHKIAGKLWVSVEGAYTLQHVSKIEVKGLPSHFNSSTLETRMASPKLVVDDMVELSNVTEG